MVGAAPSRLGIEITDIFRPPRPGARPRREQESLRRRVAELAEQLYQRRELPPLSVSVHFARQAGLNKRIVRLLAEHIVELTAANTPPPEESFLAENGVQNRARLPVEVRALHMRSLGTHPRRTYERRPLLEPDRFVAATIVALPSLLLGMAGVSVVTLIALLVVWLIWPLVGAVAYTVAWVDLMGYRLIYGDQMRRAVPATVNHQNGSSAWLIAIGAIGTIRCWLTSDSIAAVLGLAGVVVLLLSQGMLFRPSTLP